MLGPGRFGVSKYGDIHHLDRDITNNALENLMLVTRAELLALNQYNYKEAPDEVKPTLLAMIKLETKLHTRFSKAVGGRRKKAAT